MLSDQAERAALEFFRASGRPAKVLDVSPQGGDWLITLVAIEPVSGLASGKRRPWPFLFKTVVGADGTVHHYYRQLLGPRERGRRDMSRLLAELEEEYRELARLQPESPPEPAPSPPSEPVATEGALPEPPEPGPDTGGTEAAPEPEVEPEAPAVGRSPASADAGAEAEPEPQPEPEPEPEPDVEAAPPRRGAGFLAPIGEPAEEPLPALSPEDRRAAEVLRQHPEGLTLEAVARALGLPLYRARNLVGHLVSRGLARRESGRYLWEG